MAHPNRRSLLVRIESLESRTLTLRNAVEAVLTDKRLVDMDVRGEIENALADLESTSTRLQTAYFNQENLP